MDKQKQLKLPNRIVTRRDVIETAREFEQLRDSLTAKQVPGSTVVVQDPTERARAVLDENGVKELTVEVADSLQKNLQNLADHAPMLRFVFAGEPEVDFLQKLISWVRTEVHPAGLVLYTIQPQIAGGYILTTDQRRYDHSWRAVLEANPVALGKLLRETDEPAATTPLPEQAPVEAK